MFDSLRNVLIGCAHRRTTFPLTSRRGLGPLRIHATRATTYVVCLDCGKEFRYNWAEMRMGKALARCEVAVDGCPHADLCTSPAPPLPKLDSIRFGTDTPKLGLVSLKPKDKSSPALASDQRPEPITQAELTALFDILSSIAKIAAGLGRRLLAGAQIEPGMYTVTFDGEPSNPQADNISSFQAGALCFDLTATVEAINRLVEEAQRVSSPPGRRSRLVPNPAA